MPGKEISPVHSDMQRAETHSVIPDEMPSPFGNDDDTDAGQEPQSSQEGSESTQGSAQESEVTRPSEGDSEGSEQPGQPSYEELQAMVAASQQDLQLLETIKSDPRAVEMLNQHFRNKTLPAGNTDNVSGIQNSNNEGDSNQVTDLINRMMQSQQQLAAQVAVMQFEKSHPDFREPKIQGEMKKIFNTPGYENMRLDDAYQLAKARAGIQSSPQSKAPALKASETGGASAPSMVGRNDSPSLQKSIDEQKSLEDAVKLSLQHDFRGEGIELGDE